MYITQCVLALLSLYAGLVCSFSWDIIISNNNQLEFYDFNGTQTHTQNVTSSSVKATVYDPVHNRVLFADHRNIFSFEIASKTIKCLVRNTTKFVVSLAYDPATDVLFWSEHFKDIYSISLKPGFNNKMEDKHLVLSQDGVVTMDVDSCRGFIYWISNFRGVRNLQRARFNGSDAEVVIDPINTLYFKIDQQAQKIFWFDQKKDTNVLVTAQTFYTYTGYLKCADLNGKNVKTILTYPEHSNSDLTISKDLIYWKKRDSEIWSILKNPLRDIDEQPTFLMKYGGGYSGHIAANYNIEDLTRGIDNCQALTNLLPNNTVTNVPSDVSLLCVHGTKVSGESRCECTLGYSGERCDVSLCHNFCFRGDCSVSAEGLPKCRCYAGFSGERCEVFPCQGYCLNSGVCSLNERHEPVCQCSEDYGGERCDVPDVRSILGSIPQKDVTLVTEGKGVESTSASTPSNVV